MPSSKEDRGHWAGDLLARQNDAEFLYAFLLGQVEHRRDLKKSASYVLNIDAKWGGGKSFFLERLAIDLEKKGHLVARVNAWRDDHAADPYIAIMAAIDRTFSPYISKSGGLRKTWEVTKRHGGPIAVSVAAHLTKTYVKNKLGKGGAEILAEAISDNLIGQDSAEAILENAQHAGKEIEALFDRAMQSMIDGFRRTDKAIDDFRSNLAKVMNSLPATKAAPLFILVDELDRCRPTYAISLLERVKHLFDVDNVVFIFATNADQLQHSVSGAYGPNFDGFNYLKRFFDRTYVFRDPERSSFIGEICKKLPIERLSAPGDNIEMAFITGAEAFDLDLRSIEHVMEMVDATVRAWPHRSKIDVTLLLPLCVNFYKTGKVAWPEETSVSAWKWTRSTMNRQGQKVDNPLRYGTVHSILKKMVHQKNDEIDPPTGGDPDRQYAYNFIREEAGAGYHGRHSNQLDLIELIGHVSRLTTTAM